MDGEGRWDEIKSAGAKDRIKRRTVDDGQRRTEDGRTATPKRMNGMWLTLTGWIALLACLSCILCIIIIIPFVSSPSLPFPFSSSPIITDTPRQNGTCPVTSLLLARPVSSSSMHPTIQHSTRIPSRRTNPSSRPSPLGCSRRLHLHKEWQR